MIFVLNPLCLRILAIDHNYLSNDFLLINIINNIHKEKT